MQQKLLIFPLIAITVFFAIWSPVGNFIEFPKYWWDEAFAIEQARTFLEIKKVDFTIAPNTPSSRALTLSATGPTMTIPLAGVFSLFGTGILQARIYMLGWIAFSISILFFFLKRFFDFESAIAGTLLVITFASFWANGRTATGDIPGLVFLLGGLWLTFGKGNFFLGGIFIALTAITKTSVFHMTIPAFALTIFLTQKKEFLLPSLKAGMGGGLTILFWLALLLPLPYTLSDIKPVVEFYKNPVEKASLLERMPYSMSELLLSPTIIYFVLIMGILMYAYRKNAFQDSAKCIVFFVFIYSALQMIVFLRSPGWIRYLIGIQILLLAFLYPSLRYIFSQWVYNKKYTAMGIIIALAIMQSVQYMFFSNIFPKAKPEETAYLINKLLMEHPERTILFVDDPTNASLVSASKKYQRVQVGGDTYIGRALPDYTPEELPSYAMGDFREEELRIIEKYYKPFQLQNGAVLYQKQEPTT